MAQETLKFDDQVVVVTGGGQGVGRGYVRELARRGARIVVNDLGRVTGASGAEESVAERVAAEIRAAGGQAVADTHSVATREGGEGVIETALKTWGRIDALIHNAGILRDASFVKMTDEQIEAVLSVHLRGAFYVAQPAFRAMKESGRGGRILLTTSSSGLFGMFGQTNYTAAKMGIVGLVRTLAIEGSRNQIKVNAIAPTAGTRLTGGGDLPDDALLAPARIAPAAAVLCHPDCPSTGEIFQVGGGWVARVKVDITEGYVVQGNDAQAEELLAHWSEVREGAVHEPRTAIELGELMQRRLGVEKLEY